VSESSHDRRPPLPAAVAELGEVGAGPQLRTGVGDDGPELLIEAPDPGPWCAADELGPGELYARHCGYARALAEKVGRAQGCSAFAREELVDAALQGLLDAALLWQERGHGARFTTYAYWHVKGNVLDRAEELRRSRALPEPGQGPELSAGEREDQLAWRDWPYVEQSLARLAQQSRVAEAVRELRADGALSPLEDCIVDPLLLEARGVVEVADEAQLNLAQVRAAATRLMQRVRVALRDDSLLPQGVCRLPLERLPCTRPEALRIAQQTLQLLAQGTPARPRPLAALRGFLPDLATLRAEVGMDPHDPRARSGPARLLSFYAEVHGLRQRELASALEMNPAAVDKLLRQLKLDGRSSPARILELANALGIDPEQVLFRSLPAFEALFERVLYAGDDVYLAFVPCALPPAELLPYLGSEARPEGLAHGFGPVIAAHRLSCGVPSAASLGRSHKAFEAGTHSGWDGTIALARAVGLDPLLALLGTRAELLDLFDLVDERGHLLRASRRDYARLVLVLQHQPPPAPGPAPLAAGLGPFLAHLLRRLGPRLLPERLAAAGVSLQQVANALAGRPPHQPAALAGLSRLLGLDPWEEARLACESLLPRVEAELAPELRELIALAREQSEGLHSLLRHGWDGLDAVMAADPSRTRELTAEFFERSRRGYRSYLQQLGALWREELPVEALALCRARTLPEGRDLLVRGARVASLPQGQRRVLGAMADPARPLPELARALGLSQRQLRDQLAQALEALGVVLQPNPPPALRPLLTALRG